MGGVVNVITRDPGNEWRYGATAEGSRAEGNRGGDGHRLSARADGPLGGGIVLRAGAATTRVEALASPEDPRISELEGRDKNDGWLGLGWRGAGPGAAVELDDLALDPQGRHLLDVLTDLHREQAHRPGLLGRGVGGALGQGAHGVTLEPGSDGPRSAGGPARRRGDGHEPDGHEDSGPW